MSFTFSNGVEIFSEDNSVGLNVTQPRRTMDISGDLGITGNIYMGTTSFVTNNARLSLNTTNPLTSVHINANDGIIIPVGTNAQRVGVTGVIRFNSESSTFEGYSGSTWGNFGGVSDIDLDTYISAETTVGADNDQLKFYTAGVERLLIDVGGDTTVKSNLVVDNNLVVGSTQAVNGKIEIVGNIGNVSSGSSSYLKAISNGTFLGVSGATTGNSYSLYADGKIAGLEFNAISDKRVKEILNPRNIESDLDFIKRINVYDYKFIDKLEYGDIQKVGFIAQEIQKINNNFVNKSKRFIPSIYKKFNFKTDKTVMIEEQTDIKENDLIKIEIELKDQEVKTFDVKVIKRTKTEMTIETIENINISKGVFVYGKYVEDFLTVDINQLISVNTNTIKYLLDKINNYDNDLKLIKEKLNM